MSDMTMLEFVEARLNEQNLEEPDKEFQQWLVAYLRVDADPDPSGDAERSPLSLEEAATTILRQIAVLYAEHPDFQREWRPW